MPTVKLVQDQDASPEVQGMFKHLEQDKGMVPLPSGPWPISLPI